MYYYCYYDTTVYGIDYLKLMRWVRPVNEGRKTGWTEYNNHHYIISAGFNWIKFFIKVSMAPFWSWKCFCTFTEEKNMCDKILIWIRSDTFKNHYYVSSLDLFGEFRTDKKLNFFELNNIENL